MTKVATRASFPIEMQRLSANNKKGDLGIRRQGHCVPLRCKGYQQITKVVTWASCSIEMQSLSAKNKSDD